jgi:hypothetical protein
MSPEEMMDLMTREEHLHADLLPYYDPEKRLLNAPLVQMLFHDEARSGFANAQYAQKERSLGKALVDENWNQYVWLHERPYRLWAFGQIKGLMSDRDYWEILGAVWIDSENIWQNKQEWLLALSSPRKEKKYLMNPTDRKALRELPDELRVYRGIDKDKGDPDGFSWTLSRAKAEWFADRYWKNGIVLEQVVKKKDVTAHFLGRGEQEVVLI